MCGVAQAAVGNVLLFQHHSGFFTHRQDMCDGENLQQLLQVGLSQLQLLFRGGAVALAVSRCVRMEGKDVPNERENLKIVQGFPYDAGRLLALQLVVLVQQFIPLLAKEGMVVDELFGAKRHPGEAAAFVSRCFAQKQEAGLAGSQLFQVALQVVPSQAGGLAPSGIEVAPGLPGFRPDFPQGTNKMEYGLSMVVFHPVKVKILRK